MCLLCFLCPKGALDVESITQLKDAIQAAEKLFGWNNKPPAKVNVGVAVGLVCTEEQRMRLIALREKLQAPLPAQPAPIPLPEPCRESQVGAPDGNSATSHEMPGSHLWNAPAGAQAPSNADPAYRAWLEYEKPEPE
jgi:hypothetical protein